MMFTVVLVCSREGKGGGLHTGPQSPSLPLTIHRPLPLSTNPSRDTPPPPPAERVQTCSLCGPFCRQVDDWYSTNLIIFNLQLLYWQLLQSSSQQTKTRSSDINLVFEAKAKNEFVDVLRGNQGHKLTTVRDGPPSPLVEWKTFCLKYSI